MRGRICVAAMVIAAIVGLSRGSDSKAVAAPSPGQDSTTLDDQVELAVTVYNSDIALVRDVRNVQLGPGSFDLKFMDIAATVNPATVHFRSLTEPSRLSRPRAELRVRSARAGEAAAQVRRPRRHAGADADRERRPRGRRK